MVQVAATGASFFFGIGCQIVPESSQQVWRTWVKSSEYWVWKLQVWLKNATVERSKQFFMFQNCIKERSKLGVAGWAVCLCFCWNSLAGTVLNTLNWAPMAFWCEICSFWLMVKNLPTYCPPAQGSVKKKMHAQSTTHFLPLRKEI